MASLEERNTERYNSFNNTSPQLGPGSYETEYTSFKKSKVEKPLHVVKRGDKSPTTLNSQVGFGISSDRTDIT